jgi:hypothetical protein
MDIIKVFGKLGEIILEVLEHVPDEYVDKDLLHNCKKITKAVKNIVPKE